MQKRLCGSVQVFSLDRDRTIAGLRQMAQSLLRRDRRVEVVALFGSLAQGRAVPGSDADLLIILHEHGLPRWFDRIPEYLLDAAIPVEAFPFTWAEVQRGVRQPGLIRSILRDHILLAGRPAAVRRLQQLREKVRT